MNLTNLFQNLNEGAGASAGFRIRLRGLGEHGVFLLLTAFWVLIFNMPSFGGDAASSTSKVELPVAADFSGSSPISVSHTNAASSADLPFAVGSNGVATLDDKRRLSVGDHLFFHILEDNDEPKQLVVTDSGEVEVPYLGRLPVQGVTCKQLASTIKKSLEAKYYYHATVTISCDSMSKALGKVYVSGALRTPGRLEIPGNESFTLSKAVLCAGGFLDYADKRNVKVTRRSESGGTNSFFTVDVGQILEKGRTELDLPLEPGDMIFVPERLNIF